MKARTSILVITILFLGQFLFAQGWQRVFDIQNPALNDLGINILLADNGDYLTSGISGDEPSLSSAFVSRISPDGRELWTQVYSNTNPNSLNLTHGGMVKASDGGYILAGTALDESPRKLLIIKLNEFGDSLWTKSHPLPGGIDSSYLIQRITNTSDGGYVLVGANDGVVENSILVKVDVEANLEWIEFVDIGSEYTRSENIIQSSDGHFILTGTFEDGPPSNRRIFIQKRTLDGEVVWTKDYEEFPGDCLLQINGLRQLDNGSLILSRGNGLLKMDSLGDVEWEELYPSFCLLSVNAALDGGYLLTGEVSNLSNLLVAKTDSVGNVLWSRLLEEGAGLDLIQDADSSIIVTGSTFLNNSTDLYVVKTDVNGQLFQNLARGRVFRDEDFNCLDDSGEPGMRSSFVRVIGMDTLYAFTDEEGYYEIDLDTGSYHIRSIYPNPYWETCIDDPFPFEINNAPDTVLIDLPAQVGIECPYLEVDVSTPRLTRCVENTYYVRYCNSGTAKAEDAIVTIVLDPFLEYQNASIDPSAQNGDTLLFEVGDIEVNECGAFDITTFLNCDLTVPDQAHCVTALISPDSICLQNDPEWTGASLKVDAECTGDSLFFTIENIGLGNMASPQNYIVTEDVIMYNQGQVDLMSGQSMRVLAEATNGATWRLEVDQVEGHPGNSQPSVVVEGCVPFGEPFTQNFTNAFPQDDGNPFVSIDCQENDRPYNSNDKRGFPYGWDTEYYIEKNEDLEYMIQFQNTGMDTVARVEIKDQIDPNLDIETIIPGASSHPYELGFEGSNVLIFTFTNIMLPDSTVNEAASNGFVKFKISQKEDLPHGTVIRNEASIYFDFNVPMSTEKTFHTVIDSLASILVNVEPAFVDNVSIKAYPNPFEESTTIEIKGNKFTSLDFLLFDVHGRLIATQKTRSEQIILQRNGLSPGIYFYRIESDGQLIGVGKLIVQ